MGIYGHADFRKRSRSKFIIASLGVGHIRIFIGIKSSLFTIDASNVATTCIIKDNKGDENLFM